MKLPEGVTEIRGHNFDGRKYPHRDLTESIIGCAIAVHRELQAGYVEAIYENALAHELRKAGLFVERQVKFPVYYDGVAVGEHRADLIVERKVVVELKAVADLGDRHVSQVMSTLRAAGIKVGLLLNFNESRLVNGLRRIIM
jgi:GxxExxY protein